MYFISICIPTFNRANYLDQLLQSIADELNSVNFSMQIVISDNASSDNTSQIIEKWEAKNLPIKYIRNNSNFGAIYNVANCINYSDAQYSLLIGDDDIIRKGSLAIFNQILNQYNPDVIISDRYVADINMKIKGEEKSSSLSKISVYDFKSQNSFDYFDTTVSTIGIFSFISNLCIRTDSWKKSQNYSLTSTSLFPHAIKILDILTIQKGTLLYLPASTVIARLDNDRVNLDVGPEYENSHFLPWHVHFEGFMNIAELFFKHDRNLMLRFMSPIARIIEAGKYDYIRLANIEGQNSKALEILNKLNIST